MRTKQLIIAVLLLTFAVGQNTAEKYFESGLAKAKLGDYSGAIVDYTKAIEIDPNYADACVGRGAAKYLNGDETGGCADLRKAGELGGDPKVWDFIKEYCK